MNCWTCHHNLAKLLMFCSLSLAQAPGPESSSPCRDADLLVVNAKIITMKSGDEIAQAIAVRGNRIVAVGGDAEIRSCAKETTRLLDLHGRTVLPGLIDVHTHAMSWASEVVRGVLDLRYPNAGSIAEVRQLVGPQHSRRKSVCLSEFASRSRDRDDPGLGLPLLERMDGLSLRDDAAASTVLEANGRLLTVMSESKAVAPRTQPTAQQGSPRPVPSDSVSRRNET